MGKMTNFTHSQKFRVFLSLPQKISNLKTYIYRSLKENSFSQQSTKNIIHQKQWTNRMMYIFFTKHNQAMKKNQSESILQKQSEISSNNTYYITRETMFNYVPVAFTPLAMNASCISSNASSSGSLVEENPQSCHQNGNDQFRQNLKENSLVELRKKYESKVLENCQRTARVILICELEKKLHSKKGLKLELNQILQQYVPRKKQIDSEEEYGKIYSGNYYQSVSYSRVKIGQKVFEKKILLNSTFREEFIEIFQNKDLANSDKPRKNERSRVSFQERRNILKKIIEINQVNFIKNMKLSPMTYESSIIPGEQLLTEEKKQVSEPMEFIPQFIFPIFPIPLHPNEYSQYMKDKFD